MCFIYFIIFFFAIFCWLSREHPSKFHPSTFLLNVNPIVTSHEATIVKVVNH